jgi:hypothetical protein
LVAFEWSTLALQMCLSTGFVVVMALALDSALYLSETERGNFNLKPFF